MSLDEKMLQSEILFMKELAIYFKKWPDFGYPENPGMPTIYEMPSKLYARSQFIDSLPKHQTYWASSKARKLVRNDFGPSPKVDTVPRFIYE
jgi:hypothetical protein